MTTLTTTMARASAIAATLPQLGIAAPSSIQPTTPGGSQATMTWTPDLSPADAATVASVAQLAVDATLITPAERTALNTQVAEIRTFRTRTAAEWQAMTAVQRDNALIQWCQDITDVLRAILRD